MYRACGSVSHTLSFTLHFSLLREGISGAQGYNTYWEGDWITNVTFLSPLTMLSLWQNKSPAACTMLNSFFDSGNFLNIHPKIRFFN